MKKKLLICVFLLLILITAICTIVSAIESYKYDIEIGVDMMAGMGAAMLIVLGCFVIFYELDLFYTAYYFFIKPKTIAKSILTILSNVSLLLVFFSVYIANALSIREETLVTMALFCIYVVLRSVCLMVSTRTLVPADAEGRA